MTDCLSNTRQTKVSVDRKQVFLVIEVKAARSSHDVSGEKGIPARIQRNLLCLSVGLGMPLIFQARILKTGAPVECFSATHAEFEPGG
jgi:hypothetical protein